MTGSVLATTNRGAVLGESFTDETECGLRSCRGTAKPDDGPAPLRLAIAADKGAFIGDGNAVKPVVERSAIFDLDIAPVPGFARTVDCALANAGERSCATDRRERLRRSRSRVKVKQPSRVGVLDRRGHLGRVKVAGRVVDRRRRPRRELAAEGCLARRCKGTTATPRSRALCRDATGCPSPVALLLAQPRESQTTESCWRS
jgi:hypothetical protein